MFSALFSKGLQKAGNKVTNTDHEVLIKSINLDSIRCLLRQKDAIFERASVPWVFT